MATLAEQFPDLAFAKDADVWLASLKETGRLEPLSEQFRDRRIKRFRIEALIWGGVGVIEGDFYIGLPDWQKPSEDAVMIGHEIGHTFQYDLSKPLPTERLDGELSDEEFWRIEKFCDVFAEQWLAINGREKIEEAAANQRRCIFQHGLCYHD